MFSWAWSPIPNDKSLCHGSTIFKWTSDAQPTITTHISTFLPSPRRWATSISDETPSLTSTKVSRVKHTFQGFWFPATSWKHSTTIRNHNKQSRFWKPNIQCCKAKEKGSNCKEASLSNNQATLQQWRWVEVSSRKSWSYKSFTVKEKASFIKIMHIL